MNGDDSKSARQSFLGDTSQTDLKAVRVGIIGLCGGGSHVAQQLAHVGIGHFVLVDFDYIEPSNLNRMIGSHPKDAFRRYRKTTVIRRLIKSISPSSNVLCFNKPWQECAFSLRSCNLVFGCVDSFEARNELEAYCRRFLIPYVDIGMDVTKTADRYYITGQVITSLPGRPCMRCVGFLTDDLLAEEAARYGDAGQRPQVVWPNGVLASIAVGQGIRLLTRWHDTPTCPYLVYDGNLQSVVASSRLPYVPKVCPHFPPSEVGDPLWSGDVFLSRMRKQDNASKRAMSSLTDSSDSSINS